VDSGALISKCIAARVKLGQLQLFFLFTSLARFEDFGTRVYVLIGRIEIITHWRSGPVHIRNKRVLNVKLLLPSHETVFLLLLKFIKSQK
jgi:hypothetical protein